MGSLELCVQLGAVFTGAWSHVERLRTGATATTFFKKIVKKYYRWLKHEAT